MAGSATVRGVTLSQSGPVTVDLGKVSAATVVRGVNLVQGVPIQMTLTAAAKYGLSLSAVAAYNIDLEAVIE